jgi:predicted acetyltransferase
MTASPPPAPSLVLSRPTIELVGSYLQFIDEMRVHGDSIWEGMAPMAGEGEPEFVARLVRAETSATPPRVTTTTYWATISGTVVGRGALRHELTQDLAEFGGHIGYEVRPSWRRKGVATEMLRQILLTEKAREIGRLLLTCAPTNTASNKTIQANGGRLVKTSFVERIGRDTNYYWIDLPSGGGRPRSSSSMTR